MSLEAWLTPGHASPLLVAPDRAPRGAHDAAVRPWVDSTERDLAGGALPSARSHRASSYADCGEGALHINPRPSFPTGEQRFCLPGIATHYTQTGYESLATDDADDTDLDSEQRKQRKKSFPLCICVISVICG
jgi:hypothetical protein